MGAAALRVARARWAPVVARCGIAVGGVAVTTALAFHWRLNVASAGFVYLVLIILVAVNASFVEATLASIAAVACLNYFFVPPTPSFAVYDPANVTALATFEVTALVISRLSHRAQATAAEAVAARDRSERLYEVSRRMLLLDPSQEAGPLVAALVRDPATGRPFPGNVIPADRINPTARALLGAYYPLPNNTNNPSANLFLQSPIPSDTNGFDVRIDFWARSSTSATGRASRRSAATRRASPVRPPCRSPTT